MDLFGAGKNRICGVVAESTAAKMAVQIAHGLRETSTIELRMDWLRSDAERARLLRWVAKKAFREVTFIATCRRRLGGGKFSGSAEEEIRWLVEARIAGCDWGDIEVETLRELPNQSVRNYAVPKRILLSIHDFKRTPPFQRPLTLPVPSEITATKVAAYARTVTDSTRLLRLARRSTNCVAVPMGEAGLPARILALRKGSALAYAPVGIETAPGQVSLRDITHLYRAHELNRQTRVFGVIGNPIRHSLSPVLHNTGFLAQGLNAVYLPFLVKDLPDFLEAAPEFGVRGFSVTLPHKRTILRYLRQCDSLAAEIGAVNTVTVRKDGSLIGCNTDYLGVLRSLEKRMRISGSRVLIFGAGGSARAAAFALARASAQVAICSRRPRAAVELARAVGGDAVARRALRSESFDAILNATPVGMYPRAGVSPLNAQELNCRIVMDFIYRPEKTALLNLAASRGLGTVSGVEMFVAQGVAQWELWMKRKAPEKAMRRAVLAKLRAEGPSLRTDSRRRKR